MSAESAPNAMAAKADFEFEALREAHNYRCALIEEFGEFLHSRVIEVGAGIGQITAHLLELPGIERLIAIEPDGGLCQQHRAAFPGHELYEGTVVDAPGGVSWDAILSINVLEHIEGDAAELARYAALLRERRGHFCVLVPARPEIYAPIDRDFGHFRRYTRRELRGKLEAAGFEIVRLHYFNCVGYLAWWLNFVVLGKRVFEVGKVRFFDRAIFPAVHRLESKLMRPPFGQSLIAVARAVSEG
jgi:SAM-dependent methyltransferase